MKVYQNHNYKLYLKYCLLVNSYEYCESFILYVAKLTLSEYVMAEIIHRNRSQNLAIIFSFSYPSHSDWNILHRTGVICSSQNFWS